MARGTSIWQAALYGGTAGAAYDSCYHRACDGSTNVDMDAIDEMSDAVAHAVYTYAMDAKTVTQAGTGGKPVKGTGTDEKRAQAHDYDAPGHHVETK